MKMGGIAATRHSPPATRHSPFSQQEACAALGLSRREFEELLPKFGFSVLSDTQATIEIELNA
jgi:hypothetical protein